MSAGNTFARFSSGGAAEWTLTNAFRPLHALLAAPALVFLATLAVMLFRPPDLQFYSLDRIAFLLLLFVVGLRTLTLRQPIGIRSSLSWPMLALLLLALSCAWMKPYDPEVWSMLAAKWLVPFVLFHLAGMLFDDDASLHKFETFALVVLAYLSLTAIFFLMDAKALIFPRYILDESIGIHADRARGPFLQAVANGVSLNILGLVALNAFRRGRLRGIWAALFLIALPLAILATKTRAVWLSFAGSTVLLLFFSSSRRVRRACMGAAIAGAVGLGTIVVMNDDTLFLGARLQEVSPVEFRMAVYQAGWNMFLERPLSGWGAHNLQPELARRISDFHQEAFYFHNTFLELLVEHGLLGLGLYLWMLGGVFRLGRKRWNAGGFEGCSFLDQQFRALWPVLVGVYVLNASFVVMNYQFVNGLLFTMAGMLAAQNRRMESRGNFART